MNVRVVGGKSEIELLKNEQRALAKAASVVAGLARHADDGLQTVASTVLSGLVELQNHFCEEEPS